MIKGGYTTSSNKINAIIDRDGLDAFVIRKLRIFQDSESVELYENRFLQKVDAATNNKFHNGHNGNNLMAYGTETYYDHMLTTYGVKYALQSEEIKQKQRRNNLKKYGVSTNLQLPRIKEKAASSLRTQKVIDKRKQTFLDKYGVENAGQVKSVRNKIEKSRKNLSDRDCVKLLRIYSSRFGIKLGSGWYQSSDEKLELILSDLQSKYGIIQHL